MRSVGLFPVLLVVAAAAAPARGETQHHVILRDGEPVGSYRLAFGREGDALVVSSELSVEVRAGFLPLFVYRHAGREVWRGETLVALDTETDDNGKRLSVTGRATAAGFHVEGPAGSLLAPADIRPTSFWRPDTVAQSRLLDSETGRVLSIVATPLADGQGAEPGSPRRYRLSGQIKHDVELCYQGDRWLSARFRMLGSDIEFRARDAAVPSQVAIAQ